MKFRFSIGLILLLTVSAVPSFAQFYTPGEDPASLKWNYVETDNFRVIYPVGRDSLALRYARSLESVRESVGGSILLAPNETFKKRHPVILHTESSYSNGFVSWAPRRMELYTCPEPYETSGLPWMTNLTVHESRHVAQMQVGNYRSNRPFGWFLGQIWAGACAGLYYKNDFLEGDAVVTETALTPTGRGRNADFQNYYMTAFDNGDWRSWLRWMGGSQKNYTPDHYALGYMYYSGMRYFYDAPNLSGEYLDLLGRRPFELFTYQDKVAKTHTDSLNFNKVFRPIAEKTYEIWRENAEARRPYMPVEQIVPTPRKHAEYHENALIDENMMFSVKESKDFPTRLVRTDSLGRERVVSPFSNLSGMVYYSPGHDRLFWSETIYDPRWGHKSKSVIRYRDKDGLRAHNLTRKGRLFNPNPSPSENHITATEYPVEGGSNLVVLSAHDGRVEARFKAPDTLQIVESAWIGDAIYVSAISEAGFGVYHFHSPELYSHDIDEDELFEDADEAAYDFETVLAPEPVKIKNFGYHDDRIMFTCDRTGADELYLLDPETGVLEQKTSTRYGGSEYQFSEDGRWLVFSCNSHDGSLLSKTPVDSLFSRKVDWADHYRYPIADGIAAQEKSFGIERIPLDSVTVSDPKRYRKFPHLFNFHSWAPFYANVDNIMAFSYDKVYDLVGLGATALSQNALGTAVTQFGYCAHKDPMDKNLWRHSGHIKYTYRGWYPVFEAALDINDRGRANTTYEIFTYDKKEYYIKGNTVYDSRPLIEGSLKVYVPLSWNKGGWSKGFIPQVSLYMNSDAIDGLVPVKEYSETGEDPETGGKIYDEGKVTDTRSFGGRRMTETDFRFSLRGYSMLPTADAGVYPRWGIGAELGYVIPYGFRSLYGDSAYAYLYGYVPGFYAASGFRLTAMGETSVKRTNQPFPAGAVNTLPRGFVETAGAAGAMRSGFNSSLRLTGEYGCPIYIGDLGAVGGLIYIKRLVLTPHFDYTMYFDRDWKMSSGLYSAGATLAVDMSFLLWLNFPLSLGVTYSYNGGPGFDNLKASIPTLGHHFVGPVFELSFY
ncbi:MAG: hypothetical protein MJY56_01235 [Bacteroidales bacterium]|nr:hypothetical protein [Bacteroidales bacterium]